MIQFMNLIFSDKWNQLKNKGTKKKDLVFRPNPFFELKKSTELN